MDDCFSTWQKRKSMPELFTFRIPKPHQDQGDQIGQFFASWATFKVSNWFVVDVLGFQIKLCCRYFLPFFDLATFWAIF